MADNVQEKQFEPVIIQPTVIAQIDKLNLDEVEYDTLVQMGIEVSEVKVYSQWVLGKLANSVNNKYGNLKQYCAEIKQKYEVVQQYLNVYKKFTAEDPTFTPEKYAGSVPWGFLQLAATKSDKPQELVDQLHDEGIQTTEGAYKKIKEDETGVPIPHKPNIKLTWDVEAKKYKLFLKPEDLDLIDWTDVKQQLLDYLEAHT